MFASLNATLWWDRLSAWIAHLWQWITILGYISSIIGLFFIVYATVRLFELRRREEEFYHTLILAPDATGKNPRWEHVEMLMRGKTPSEWKEAIIEADIMLDDLLTQLGYNGSIGEKLKAADPNSFRTLQNAWEAHKVRNQIAHEGSSFNISDTLLNRTLSHYRAVFQEFKVI